MLAFKPGILRMENDKIYIKTSLGEQSLDIAPINKAIPYYRSFRKTINLNIIHRWPVDIVRRFIYDFQPQIDSYVARPNRATYNDLTMRLDMVIQRAIQPPRQ